MMNDEPRTIRLRDPKAPSGTLAGILARFATTLAVAAALALGASTAFAEPVYMECPYNLLTGELGACVSDTECDSKCFDIYGFNPTICEDVGGQSCCRCLI